MLPESAPPGRNSSRRILLRVGLACASLVVLLGVAILVLTLVNQARLQRELHAIEARREPVVLPAIEETDGGRTTLAWLQQFDGAEGSDDEWLLESAEGVARFLDAPEGRALDADTRARLELLKTCVGRDWPDSLGLHCTRLLEDGVPLERWSECERAYVLTRELAYPRLRRALAEEIPSSPLDPSAGPGVQRIPQHIDWPISAVRALFEPTGALVARGEAPELCARIEKMLQVGELLRRQVSLIALQTRVFLRGHAVAAVRVALAQLPPEAPLDRLEARLGPLEDARAQYRRALLEERAMGTESYAVVASGGDAPADYARVRALPAWLCFDQLYYLDSFGEALAIAEHAQPLELSAELKALEERMRAHFDSWWRYTTPLAAFLLPRFSQTWVAACENQAWNDLVRLGLRVRRLAPEQALAEVSHSSDPYSEAPLRGRIEAGGVLVIWSVGPNGRDDGALAQLELEKTGMNEDSGRAEHDDLVLRVRMH